MYQSRLFACEPEIPLPVLQIITKPILRSQLKQNKQRIDHQILALL